MRSLGDGRGREHGAGPRLANEWQIVGGPEEGVQEDRYGPGPDRAEERVYVLGGVRQDDEDALLLLDARLPERRRDLADASAELPAADVRALRLRPQAEGDRGVVAVAEDLRRDVQRRRFVHRGAYASL